MMEHYTCALGFIAGSMPLAERKRRVAERDANRTKLKAAGWKERYFQFTRGNVKQEARAKVLAEAEAKLWFEQTGVKLEVCKGCFL